MDSKEERSMSKLDGASKRKRRRKGFGVVLSCFGGGSDHMSDDEPAMGSRGKSLTVVPVESSSVDSDHSSSNGEAIVGKEERMMSSRKSFKDKSKRTNAPTKPQPTQEIITVYHVASDLKTQIEPAPLYRMLDPVQTQTRTRTSNPGSPVRDIQPTLREVGEENSKKNGYGPSMGLVVLTTALAMMVIGGLTLGVICMCAWFCVLYMLQRPGINALEKVGTSEEKSEEVNNVNSEEYKKKVVLRGFLERDKRN